MLKPNSETDYKFLFQITFCAFLFSSAIAFWYINFINNLTY